jgi:hypothetical protein
MTDVHAWADQLRQYATHFEMRDWCYTRDLGDLRPIRHGSSLPHLKRAIGYLVRGTSNIFPEESMRPSRWAMAKAAWRARGNAPDGILDGGSIITFWEETGEYLQYVQPSVGALLADLMDAHPDLPEVVAIASEMKRINDDYGRRIRSGDPEGDDA